MKYTAESRWFYEESPADQMIQNWFKNEGPGFMLGNKRTDLYLSDGAPGKGVKLRDGRLEIKLNVHNWPHGTVGKANYTRSNSWKKYSFVLDGADAEAAEITHDFAGLRSIGVNHDWVRLDKDRKSIKYALDIDGEAAAKVKDSINPQQGCMVDYTRIEVNLRKTYLSFGFEAFGDGMMVKKSLDIVMAAVFKDSGISGLARDTAMSFPEFILRV